MALTPSITLQIINSYQPLSSGDNRGHRMTQQPLCNHHPTHGQGTWHTKPLALLVTQKEKAAKLTALTVGSRGQGILMVLTQEPWAFQRSGRGRFLWPKPAWPVFSAGKSLYVVASHGFDVNLEILYSFLPSCFPLTHLGMYEKPLRVEGRQ